MTVTYPPEMLPMPDEGDEAVVIIETVGKGLLISVLREMMEAEAAYRSAMNIYKDHPGHMTRIRAESRWFHAKSVAKCILNNCDAKRS